MATGEYSQHQEERDYFGEEPPPYLPAIFHQPSAPPFFTGPSGGFGVTGYGPPHKHYSPLCATIEVIGAKLRHLTEPVVYVGFGLLVIWLLKTLLAPHVHLLSTTFKSRAGTSFLDELTDTVEQAICLPKIACNLGQNARNTSVLPPLIRLIDTKNNDRDSLLAIFKMSALRKVTDCKAFDCSPLNKPVKIQEIKKED